MGEEEAVAEDVRRNRLDVVRGGVVAPSRLPYGLDLPGRLGEINLGGGCCSGCGANLHDLLYGRVQRPLPPDERNGGYRESSERDDDVDESPGFGDY